MSILSKLQIIEDNVPKVYEAGKLQSGGVEYSNITYNEDNTVTLTESNGAIRTMTCEYNGDKLVGLKYGNEVIPLTYEDDVLVGIGGMAVDVSKAPATSGGIKPNGSVAYPFVEELESQLSVADYSAELI